MPWPSPQIPDITPGIRIRKIIDNFLEPFSVLQMHIWISLGHFSYSWYKGKSRNYSELRKREKYFPSPAENRHTVKALRPSIRRHQRITSKILSGCQRFALRNPCRSWWCQKKYNSPSWILSCVAGHGVKLHILHPQVFKGILVKSKKSLSSL